MCGSRVKEHIHRQKIDHIKENSGPGCIGEDVMVADDARQEGAEYKEARPVEVCI